MADLPAGPFAAINNIETAQGNPVSEALAQKYGTNDNDADARQTTNAADIATNVTDIATNVTDIATNVTDIAAIVQPEIFNTSLDPTGSFQTIFTFASNPTIVVVGTATTTSVVLTQTNNTGRGLLLTGAVNQLDYRLTGTLLEVREVVGTFGSQNFRGSGWN